MRRGYRRWAGLIAAAALAAAGLLAPAAAQTRGAATGGGWTPPFAPTTPAMLGGIQNLLDTPAGLKLTAEIPSLQSVRAYSSISDFDLRAVGALGAHLPSDFETRLSAAMRSSRTDPADLAALTKALGGAYQAAVPEVARAVQSRAKQVALSVAYGQIDGRELVVAANQLDRFGIYGPGVQDKASIVRRMASQQIMEHAQRIASDFLNRQRSFDDGRAQPGQGSAGTFNPGGQKKIPEDWKLHAYKKAAGPTPSNATSRTAPAPPEPKAKPMSSDLYERIGAAKDMRASEIEAAYRKTVELYRPERYIDRDTDSIIVLTMAFKRIEEAFATLGDPKKRAEYDRGGLSRQGPPAANPLSSDFYERIGATKDMPQAQIKSAYRRAAAAFHPDKSRTKDEALVKAMTKAFQDIGEAYETLGDPQKRAAYDLKPADSRRR